MILGEILSLGGIHIHKIFTQICIYFYDLIKESSETVCTLFLCLYLKRPSVKVCTDLRKKGIPRNAYTYSLIFEMPPNIP